jgi:parallel beta-helix repeat protein
LKKATMAFFNRQLSVDYLNQGVIEDNFLTDNALHGLSVYQAEGGCSISGNTANRNSTGFMLSTVRGSVTNNTAAENRSQGFTVESLDGQGRFSGNVASSNSDHGIEFTQGLWGPAQVFGNDSRNNGGRGYFVPSGTTTPAPSNNTGAGNALGGDTLP